MAVNTPHFRELDGIRGLLAVTVMAFHFGLNTAIEALTRGAVHGGVWGLCVDVFFILSGFVLCRSMSARPPGLRGYAITRWLRLAPAFLVTTAAMIVLEARMDPGAIASNLLLVQTFVGQPSINFPAWSIPAELFLPAAGIVLVPVLRRCGRGQLAIAVALLAMAEAAFLFITLRNGTIDSNPVRVLRAALGLGGGAFLYRAWEEFQPQGRPVAAYGCVVGLLGVMMLSGLYPALVLLFPLFAGGAMLFGAVLEGPFSSAPAQAVGRWSYSIYLAHIPVLTAAALVFGEAALKGLVPKAMLLVGVIAISAALYRFVEAPFMRLGRTQKAAGRSSVRGADAA